MAYVATRLRCGDRSWTPLIVSAATDALAWLLSARADKLSPAQREQWTTRTRLYWLYLFRAPLLRSFTLLPVQVLEVGLVTVSFPLYYSDDITRMRIYLRVFHVPFISSMCTRSIHLDLTLTSWLLTISTHNLHLRPLVSSSSPSTALPGSRAPPQLAALCCACHRAHSRATLLLYQRVLRRDCSRIHKRLWLCLMAKLYPPDERLLQVRIWSHVPTVNSRRFLLSRFWNVSRLWVRACVQWHRAHVRSWRQCIAAAWTGASWAHVACDWCVSSGTLKTPWDIDSCGWVREYCRFVSTIMINSDYSRCFVQCPSFQSTSSEHILYGRSKNIQ